MQCAERRKEFRRDAYVYLRKDSKMNAVKTEVILAFLFLLITIAFTSAGSYPAFAKDTSKISDSCGWQCKNLKADWDYLYHPDRINQCQPRPLQPDEKMLQLTREAFTSDNPVIPHYCGSPFSSTG